MRARFSAGTLTAFCAVTLLGCVRPMPVGFAVNSFAALNAPPYRTFVVLPLNPGIDVSDLEFQEYSGYLQKVLTSRGYQLVQSFEAAELAVFLGYGIGAPQEHAYTYNVPVWGETGVASSSTTTQVTGYGNDATVNSQSTYQPRYGVTGYRREVGSYTTFSRYAVVNAVDVPLYKAQHRAVEIWSMQIVSVGASGDLRSIVPVMLVGAIDLFGVSSGSIVEREIDANGPQVLWIRTAPPPMPAAVQAPPQPPQPGQAALPPPAVQPPALPPGAKRWLFRNNESGTVYRVQPGGYDGARRAGWIEIGSE